MAKLNLIEKPDNRFVVRNPGGPSRYNFKGDTINLKEIEEDVALRVAADPGCKFLTLAQIPGTAAPAGDKGQAPGK